MRRKTHIVRIPALQAVSLTRVFRTAKGPLVALDRTSLIVHRGEFVSIVGSSGSGKSTLLYCMSGLDRADDGAVVLHGQLLYGQDKRVTEAHITEVRARHMSFVFQRSLLLRNLSVLDNVVLPLRLTGKSPKECKELALQALEEVGMLKHANQLPAKLSGGERQRVAVASAVVTEPAIILADEPTGSLDFENGRKVVTLLKELASKRNSAVVMVTHIQEHAEQADRLIVMGQGRIIEERKGADAG